MIFVQIIIIITMLISHAAYYFVALHFVLKYFLYLKNGYVSYHSKCIVSFPPK